MRVRRDVRPHGAAGHPPQLHELEPQGLDAREDAVQLRLIAQRPVQDGLDRLDLGDETLERGQDRGLSRPRTRIS